MTLIIRTDKGMTPQMKKNRILLSCFKLHNCFKLLSYKPIDKGFVIPTETINIIVSLFGNPNLDKNFSNLDINFNNNSMEISSNIDNLPCEVIQKKDPEFFVITV